MRIITAPPALARIAGINETEEVSARWIYPGSYRPGEPMVFSKPDDSPLSAEEIQSALLAILLATAASKDDDDARVQRASKAAFLMQLIPTMVEAGVYQLWDGNRGVTPVSRSIWDDTKYKILTINLEIAAASKRGYTELVAKLKASLRLWERAAAGELGESPRLPKDRMAWDATSRATRLAAAEWMAEMVKMLEGLGIPSNLYTISVEGIHLGKNIVMFFLKSGTPFGHVHYYVETEAGLRRWLDATAKAKAPATELLFTSAL